MIITAVPYKIHNKDCEAVTLFKDIDSHPSAVVPIDFFYKGMDSEKPNSIYRRLVRGEMVNLELKEAK